MDKKKLKQNIILDIIRDEIANYDHEITFQDRIHFYNQIIPDVGKHNPLACNENWMFGIWTMGIEYQNLVGDYTTYAPMFLERVYTLFPEIDADKILHIYGGSYSKEEPGDKFDLHNLNNPEVENYPKALSTIIQKKYKLIICNPPYTQEDVEKCGISLFHRGTILEECMKILEPDGFLVWMDQLAPQYKRDLVVLKGVIGVIYSIPKRSRTIFIWQRTQKRAGK